MKTPSRNQKLDNCHVWLTIPTKLTMEFEIFYEKTSKENLQHYMQELMVESHLSFQNLLKYFLIPSINTTHTRENTSGDPILFEESHPQVVYDKASKEEEMKIQPLSPNSNETYFIQVRYHEAVDTNP